MDCRNRRQARNEITGGKNLDNEVFPGFDPQTGYDTQTGKYNLKIVGGGSKTGIISIYRIQIQASKTYIQVDAVVSKLDLKEKVSVELRSDGWYRYYVGQYTVLGDARTKLAELRAKGIKDAFVVSFKASNRKVIK